MEKKPVVNYQDAMDHFSEDYPSRDDAVMMPEIGRDQTVDFQAVSDQWKEDQGRMLRKDREEEDHGTEH